MESPMAAVENTMEWLAVQLADPDAQWSLGTFGAIAEFCRDAAETADVERSETALSVVTARGAIRLEPNPSTQLFACETATRQGWNQHIALCLPSDRCAMNRRATLTELGPDAQALRQQDRDAMLFDLGLDAQQADLCIRVADTDVIAELRHHAGRSVLEPANPSMAIILAANPHRVFVSRLGRIEVFQPIPPANGNSPDGPHTHVLPDLLKHRRSHAATVPVPEGLIPCADLYPAHPANHRDGQSRGFDAERFGAFQDLLIRFGDPALLALKRSVFRAIAAGQHPDSIDVSANRFARMTIRVALRQYRMMSGASPVLAQWTEVFEPAGREEPETDAFVHELEHAAGHAAGHGQ
jgi:hypothetical protein